MNRTLLGILVVSIVSAAGDYVWYEFGVRHRMWVGVLHGALLLTAVGAVIGAASGRLAAGLPIGTLAGVAGALAYYALVPVGGSSAMLLAWGVLWVVLAVLDARLVRRGTRSLPEALVHGLSAAVLSGVTFYLVVDILWGRAPDEGRNYLIQCAAWAIAWAPGIIGVTQEFKRR